MSLWNKHAISSVVLDKKADLGPNEELAGPPESPTGRSERIVTLDVLRGFALLGILTVNVEDFAGPESTHDVPMELVKAAFVGWHAHLDMVILTIKWLFVEGKMRGMFAMLFGAGAVLLTERIERRGQPGRAADIFLRRNLWLALFGLLHGTLIWDGDILLDYGLCGLLFLFPLRHIAPRKLVGIGLTIWIVGGTFGYSNIFHYSTAIRESRQLSAAVQAQDAGQVLTKQQKETLGAVAEKRKQSLIDAADDIKKKQQGYLDGLPARTAGYLAFTAKGFTSGLFLECVGQMILGMGLYKLGFLSARRRARTYLTVAIAGYAVSAPIVLIGIWHASLLGFTKAAVRTWMDLPYHFETVPATLANASILLFLVQKKWLHPVLNRLGSVGRTAFSNYIMTSVLCQFVFAWGPWKLYGRLEYYQYLYVVAAVWALNLIVSPLWLRIFAFGPLEWMWRSLTYWRRQPFRLLA